MNIVLVIKNTSEVLGAFGFDNEGFANTVARLITQADHAKHNGYWAISISLDIDFKGDRLPLTDIEAVVKQKLRK